MAGETILIVDDSRELTGLLEAILRDGGYVTISVNTATEGLELLSTMQPDAILVDLELPDMNGIKLLRELNQRGVNIPTIMMTAYGSEGTAARALKLGVRDYLIKPFTTEEILFSLQRVLADHRAGRERDRLNVLLNEYSRQFTLLVAVSQFLTSGMERERLLQRIVEAGLYATRADAGRLLLLEQPGQLQVAVALGQAGPPGGQVPCLAGDEGLRPVLEEGKAVRLCSDSGEGIQLQTGERVQAVLQVPIQGQGRNLGLLSVDRRGKNVPFQGHDEQVLKILAGYAAIALEIRSPLPVAVNPAV